MGQENTPAAKRTPDGRGQRTAQGEVQGQDPGRGQGEKAERSPGQGGQGQQAGGQPQSKRTSRSGDAKE